MKRGYVLCWLAIAGASYAAAQVEFPNGVKPRTPQQYSPAEGAGDRYVLVERPNTVVRAAPRESAPVVKRAGFREAFLAYGDNPEYYLVKEEPDVWGYIRKDEVLARQYSMTPDDKAKAEGAADGGTRSASANIFLKAVIRNNLQISVSQSVNLLSGPGPDYPVVETVSLADIYFVFDWKKGRDGKEYVLLGWDAAWDSERASADNIVRGWVRLEQCTIWDSRVAVYYSRNNTARRPKVAIYRTLAEAQTGDTKNAIALESENSLKSLTYSRSRFPVLQDARNGFLKIAYIADPSKDLKISLDAANKAQETLRNMQVLFIIDGTISMGPYFKQVQRAVRDYVASIPSQELPRYHFAVSVYRDYEDGPNGEMELIAGFDDPSGFDKLGDLKERSDPSDKTLEEAVFNGIIRSVKAVKWQEGNFKVVVVIGDHPNHPVDTRGFTADKVVRELRAIPGAGFQFHALNVHYTEELKHLNQEFVAEMRQIANQFTPAGKIEMIRNNGANMEDFRRSVVDVLHRVIMASGNLGEITTGFREGKTANELAPIYGTDMTALAIRLLAELHITPEIINQSGVTQISQDGWVRSTTGADQLMEPWVYIERTRLDEYRGFLASLVRVSAQRSARSGEIVAQAVQHVTGDPLLPRETVAEYATREFVIPFRDDSTILNKTPDQLQQALGEQNFWSQFRKRVSYSYEVLGLVEEEKDPAALRWDEAQRGWIVQNAAHVTSWVTSRGGEKYCWVPMGFLP